MVSARTDPVPAAQPRPGTAQRARRDRPAVWAAGLAKSYGPTMALTGLDLQVAAGETVALLGPNGAGKTTTIGLLLGLLSPGRGQVRVCGRKIADGPPAAIKASFGDQQIRLTLHHGPRALLDALDGVRAVEQDNSRVILHSSDTDATVSSLVRSDLRWSGLEIGGPDLETSFLRLLGDQS